MASYYDLFRERLLANDAVLDAFRLYLKKLRDTRWISQEALLSDESVKEIAREENLKPATLLRILNREISGEESDFIAEKSLKRVLRVLKEIQADEDLEKVLRLFIESDAVRDIESAKIGLSEKDGQLVLEKNVLIKGTGREHYLILALLSKSDYPEFYDKSGEKQWSFSGQSYLAKKVGTNDHVFVKIPCLNVPRNGQENLAYHRDAHCLNELVQILSGKEVQREKLATISNVAKPLDFGHINFTSHGGRNFLVPFIVFEFIEGKSLAIQFNHKTQIARNGQDWFDVVWKIVKIVRKLHLNGIYHGDLRPQNIIMTECDGRTDVHLVGFYENIISSIDEFRVILPDNNIKARGSLFAAHRLKDAFYPHEAVDQYSLGELFLWLATGVTVTDVYVKYVEKNKSLLEADGLVWDMEVTLDFLVFLKKFILINERVCAVMFDYRDVIAFVVCQCVSGYGFNRGVEVSDIEGTLEAEQLIARRQEPSRRQIASEISDTLSSFRKSAKMFEGEYLFSSMVKSDVLHSMRKLTEMLSVGRSFTSGSREEIITSLLNYISLLGPGSSYYEACTFDLWKPHNLGLNGRYLAATVAATREGVKVRRVLLATPDDRDLLSERYNFYKDVIDAQAESLKAASKVSVVARTNEVGNSGYGVYCYQVFDQDPNKWRKVIKGSFHIGLLKHGRDMVSISFQTGLEGTIRKILIKKLALDEYENSKDEIEKLIANSYDIDDEKNVGGDDDDYIT